VQLDSLSPKDDIWCQTVAHIQIELPLTRPTVAFSTEADVDDAAVAGGDAAMDEASAADVAAAGAAPVDLEVVSDDSGTATEEDATRPVLDLAVRDATAQIIVRLAASALSSKVLPSVMYQLEKAGTAAGESWNGNNMVQSMHAMLI
jgi:hypothetical protein